MKNKLFTIQEAAAYLKVSANTLRRWEEAGTVKPIRTLGNQRRYKIEDIVNLKRQRRLRVDKNDSLDKLVGDYFTGPKNDEAQENLHESSPVIQQQATPLIFPVPEVSPKSELPTTGLSYSETNHKDLLNNKSVPHWGNDIKVNNTDQNEKSNPFNVSPIKKIPSHFLAGTLVIVFLFFASFIWQSLSNLGLYIPVSNSGGKTTRQAVLGAKTAVSVIPT